MQEGVQVSRTQQGCAGGSAGEQGGTHGGGGGRDEKPLLRFSHCSALLALFTGRPSMQHLGF